MSSDGIDYLGFLQIFIALDLVTPFFGHSEFIHSGFGDSNFFGHSGFIQSGFGDSHFFGHSGFIHSGFGDSRFLVTPDGN